MIPFARVLKYGNTVEPPEPIEFDEVLQQQYTNTMYLHKPTNTLYGYGTNNYYQLGLKVNTTITTFSVSATNCAAFWVGVQGSMMIDTDHKIYYTGAQAVFPQAGTAGGYIVGWTDVTAYFDMIGVTANMIKGVYIGESTRILLKDGRVLACGRNTNAECGSGNSNAIPTLQVMTTMGEVIHMACTLQGTHYIKSNKQAWFCGRDNSGESGGGGSAQIYTNKFIIANVDFISTTYDVCWWFVAGRIYWAGRNNTGQAGNGATTIVITNTPTLNSVVSLALPSDFHCPSAMGNASIGTPIATYPSLVRSGGANAYGQQGTGNTGTVLTWATFNINSIQGGYSNILMATKDWCRTIIITKDYKLYACGGFNGGGGNLPNGAYAVTTLTLMPTQLWQ